MMKTTPEVLTELAALGCPLSLRTFERQRRALGIRPLGSLRTCPLRWPNDTATRLAAARGIVPADASAAAVALPVASQLATPQLVSLASLKRIAAAARKGKKGGRK